MIVAKTQPVAQQLKTVQVIPATAFDAAGNVTLDPMRKLWERLENAGIRVLIPCAGSAEFHSLSEDEIVTVIRAARRTVGNQVLVLAPIGGALVVARRLAERCLEVGANGLLVMPLEFPYLSDVGARTYYEALLDTLQAPVLLYKKGDVPSDKLLLDLSNHPWLVGVKYAVPDIPAFQQVVERDAQRSAWYCGLAERYAPYFHWAGAAGYTSGAGNVCPRITLRLFESLAKGDWQEAMRWQRVILPIEYHRARDKNSYNVTTLKYALQRCGLDFGPPRPPQRWLTREEMLELDQILEPILEAEKRLAAP